MLKMVDSHAIELCPVPVSAHLSLWLLTLGLPAGIMGGLLAFDPGKLTDPEAMTAITGALMVCTVLATVIAIALRRHRLTLKDGVLDIATTFHRQRLKLSDLVLDKGRVLDLSEHTGLKPLWKRRGTALPGLQSGWFQLRNRQKAFVAITDGRRVLWLPTRLGFDLLLQPRQPRVLLERLNEMALAGSGR